jgi:hypothetical protein
MELAAAGEDLRKLREIARTHIEKAAAGNMHAIKELADRLTVQPDSAGAVFDGVAVLSTMIGCVGKPLN